MSHPFDALVPDRVLDAVETAGFRCDGRLLALNSYENRVYQVGLEPADDAPIGSPRKSLIVKFYRPDRWSEAQILEEHAFSQELAAADLPVVAPLAHEGVSLRAFEHFRFALFERRGGRAPELDRADVRETIGRFMGRLHAVGAAQPFRYRPVLDAHSFGHTPRDWLAAQDCIPPDLRPTWLSVADQALEAVDAAYDRAGAVTILRLHGDCHLGNVLYTDDGPQFVDFDDCRMGPAIQDLWMLLSGTREEMAVQFRDVLAGYEDFRHFDTRELAIVEALRTLRLLHYAYWLAMRADDPAFPAAFPWFYGDAAQRFWQNHILGLREQVAAMQEPPLALLPRD